jgi:hypothetical protein
MNKTNQQYELSAELQADLDRQDEEANEAMAEAEGRWVDNGCSNY